LAHQRDEFRPYCLANLSKIKIPASLGDVLVFNTMLLHASGHERHPEYIAQISRPVRADQTAFCFSAAFFLACLAAMELEG
jgi:hypothetical protein